MARYFDFNGCRDKFASIIMEGWFQSSIKCMVLNTVPWENVECKWWDDFCRIDELPRREGLCSKSELQRKLRECSTEDDAWSHLRLFPLPYLAPVENPATCVGESWYQSTLDDFSTQQSIAMKAITPLDPEWYVLLHNCQILNGILTYRIMTEWYPDVKWFLYASVAHTFVSNVADIGLLDELIIKSSGTSTLDINQCIIADMYWFHVNVPISHILPNNRHYIETKLDDIDSIHEWLKEQFDLK